MPQGNIRIVDRGDRQVARSIVVETPVRRIFTLVANPHRHHELDGSGTVRDRAEGPEQIAEGDTFTVRMKILGFPYAITSTATEVVLDRVVEWQHPGGHRWRYDFEEMGPTQTRVTETFDYRESKTAKLYELMRYPARNARSIERTLEKKAPTRVIPDKVGPGGHVIIPPSPGCATHC